MNTDEKTKTTMLVVKPDLCTKNRNAWSFSFGLTRAPPSSKEGQSMNILGNPSHSGLTCEFPIRVFKVHRPSNQSTFIGSQTIPNVSTGFPLLSKHPNFHLVRIDNDHLWFGRHCSRQPPQLLWRCDETWWFWFFLRIMSLIDRLIQVMYIQRILILIFTERKHLGNGSGQVSPMLWRIGKWVYWPPLSPLSN